jgi:quinolinate synthase
MDIREEILALKKQRNAVILAHNYTAPEVQDIADMVGDSLGLSIKASETDADVIVFCGVTFMGETAKILSPKKTVLMPCPEAICDMAETCPPEELIRAKEENPDRIVIGYVNTTGPAKCHMDICCTSGNALKVVKSVADKKILFVPDKNLGRYVSNRFPETDIKLWNGCCPIHDSLQYEDLALLKERYPDAYVMAHPECQESILSGSDFVGSTEAMLKAVKDTDRKDIIVVTEVGMLHRLEKAYPDRNFVFPEKAVCKAMKLTTLEKVRDCLRDLTGRVELSDDVIRDAYAPVKRMTEIL